MNADSVRILANRIRTDTGEHLRTASGRALVVAFAVALAVPFVFEAYVIDVATQMLVFALVVTSWNFVAGYFGILTFAHAALFGVGGYAAAILAAEFGVPPLLAVPLGGVVAGAFSLPMSVSILKLHGAYVAMITIAYAEIIHLGAIIWRDVTGGPTGYIGFEPMFGGDRTALFYFVLAVVVAFLSLQYVLSISRFGLVARAIRDSEDAAQMLGNDTTRHKLLGFVVASGIAGVAGGLQAYNVLIISPPMLELGRMIEFMAMGVVGGVRTLSGGVFGVVIVHGLGEALREFGGVRLLLWGVLLMAAIFFFPNGLVATDVTLSEAKARTATAVRRVAERLSR